MNAQLFKTVFSKKLGTMVAVAEHVSSTGKGQNSGTSGGFMSAAARFVGVLSLGFILTQSALAEISANTLPQGATVNAGQVTTSQVGNTLTIQQGTERASVNWQSFDIGSGAKVNIVQPGTSSVLLNRVMSQNPTQIFGQLQANGQVVLINPNGVVFGKDGSVNASSFTASTFDISDEDFMAGKMNFKRGNANGVIKNDGTITTQGGYVALIGAKVENNGKIVSNGGNAYLAAGDKVALPITSSGRVQLLVDPSTLNTSITNTGSIVTDGGQVYLKASSVDALASSVVHSGEINTSSSGKAGDVTILATGGTIEAKGVITANHGDTSTQGADIIIGRDIETGELSAITDVSGAKLSTKNGLIETSGEYLKTTGIQVAGKEWLLDPNNIEINATSTPVTAGNSVILASDISTALGNGLDVTISTGATGATNATSTTAITGTGTQGAGTISVNSAINAVNNSGTVSTLKLTSATKAGSTITIGADMVSTGTTGVNYTINSGASDIGIVVNNSAKIDTNGGDLKLQSIGGSISLGGGLVKGKNIWVDNTNGTLNLSGITAGTSKMVGGTAVSFGTSGISATGVLNVLGSGNGIGFQSTGNISAAQFQIDGVSTASNGVNLGGATISTLANGTGTVNSYIKGTATSISAGSSTFVSGTQNINAASGTGITIWGDAPTQSATSYTKTRGLRIDGANVITNGTVTLKGSSGNSDGILLISSTGISNSGGNLTIEGYTNGNGTGGGGVSGVNQQSSIFGTTASANISIIGSATNSGATTPESGLGLGTITGAGGTLSIKGWSSSMGNSNGVSLGNISGWGNTTILAQNLRGSSGDALKINNNINVGTNNLTIQTIGGRIWQTAGTMTAGNLLVDNTGAGQVSLMNDATFTGGLTAGASMGGSITSPTVMAQGTGQSSGTQHGLLLTGITATSGTTYLSGATMDTTGTVANAVNANGSIGATAGLIVNAPTASLISGAITGGVANAGYLKKIAAGELVLTGTNTYKGGTQAYGGTLTVGNGTTVGTLGTGTISNGAVLKINHSDTVTINDAITTVSSVGSLYQSGTGTTILTNSGNNYAGGTIISAGTLQIEGAGTVGSGAITNNGTLIFNNTTGSASNLDPYGSNALYVNQSINSSSGAKVQKTGTGSVILGGSQTATTSAGADYSVTGGTLTFGSGVASSTPYIRANSLTVANAKVAINAPRALSSAASWGISTINLNGSATLDTLSSNVALQNTPLLSLTINGTGSNNLITSSATNEGGFNSVGKAITVNTTNSTDTLTSSAPIWGAGTLTKTGAGTFTTTASNDGLSGGIGSGFTTLAVNGGTFQVGNGGASGTLGTGTAAVATGANLTFNRNNTYTFDNVISGAGTLSQNGTGTTTLTATNTYSGATSVNAGTLALTGADYSSPSYTIASGGTLELNATSGVTKSYATNTTFSGAGTIKKTGTGTVVWAGSAATFAMTAGSLIDVQAGTFVGGSNGNEVWTNNKSSLNIASGATFQGVESQVMVDALTGSGTFSSGFAGYAGGLTVGVNNTSAGLYNSAGTATFSGTIQPFSTGIPSSLTKNGTGTQILTGTNTYTGGTNVNGGSLQLGNGGTTGSIVSSSNIVVASGAKIDIQHSDTYTLANVVSGAGNLSQTGTGTTVLTSTNTYSGTTTISQGTLQVGNGTTVGTLGTGNIVDNGVLAINHSDAVTLTQNITGTGSLLQSGTGTTKLSGTGNTFSGGTTVSKGTLLISNGGGNYNNSSGTGSITLGDSNTGSNNVTLQIEGGTSGQVALANSIVVANQGTGTAKIAGVSNGGTAAFTAIRGGITLNKDVTLEDTTGDRFGVDGTITGTGNVTIAGNRVTMGTTNPGGLVSTNSYTGNTIISSGSVLQANAKSIIPLTSDVIVNGELRLLDGQNQSFDSLSGTGNITTINTSGLGSTTTLSIGNNNGDGTFNGVIGNSTPTLNLIKNGTGKEILKGANTYTGTTVINGGTLQIGDAGTTGVIGTGAVTINSSANLDFNRTDTVTVTVNNTISGVGTLNFNGTNSLVNVGQSSYSLTGNNSGFNGNINISASRLGVTVANNLGSGAIAVNNNGSLYLNGAFTANNALSLGGSGWTDPSGFGQIGALRLQGATYAGNINLTSNARIGSLGTTSTVSGIISEASGGAKNLQVNNNAGLTGGTLILTGNNTYTGSTTVNSGTLQVGANTATGSTGSGDIVLLNTSSISYQKSSATTIDNNISGTGSVSATITGASNDLTMNGTVNVTGVVSLTADKNVNLNNNISTTSTSATAVTVISGKSTNAGTASGGDVIFGSSGAINLAAGAGGKIMTGSISGSTGVASAVNAGNSRYGSDETSTNYTKALTTTGLTATYRESPTLTVTLNNDSKVYDGNAYTGGNGYTTSGYINGDSSTTTTGTATYSGTAQNAKNAGTYSISGTGGVTNSLGYSTSYTNGTLTVAKADLVATGSSSSLTYNGGDQSVSGFTVSGLKGTDTVANLVSISSAGATGKNVGSYTNTVTAGTEQNYNVTTVNGTLDITKADLIATGNSSSVTYNGGTQSVTGFTVSGLKGTDTVADLVNVSAAGASGKNTGTYTNTVSAGLEQNYNVSTVDGTLTVTKADLVATGNSSSLTYNGGTQSVSGFTVSGLQGTDTVADLVNVSAAGASGKNVGSYTNTMSSGVEQNYNVTTVNGSLDIRKATVIATGNSSNVTYNGGTQSVSGFTVSGLQGTDTVSTLSTISAAGASGTNAGSYANTVTAGTEQNYTINTVNGALNIGKAVLTATGNSSSVTYNGNNQSVTGFTVTGFQGTDTLASVSTIAAAGITGKNTGSYSNVVSAGTEQNYTVNTVSGTLNIGKAHVTVRGNSLTTDYNGDSQAVTGFTASGLKGTDTIATLTSVSASGAEGKNAGSYTNTVTSGTEQNYTVTTVNGALTINKAALVATANSDAKTYNGSNQSVDGFTVSGLQGTDTIADLVTLSTSSATAKNAGTYTNTMNAGLETNYTVTKVDGSLTINKADLVATGNSSSVTYNGGTQSVSGFTVSGLKGTDTVADLVSTSAAGASGKNAGSYTNTVSTGTEQNYNVTTVNGSLNIAKADLVATGNSSSVTYNGDTQSVSGFTASGLKGSDTIADLVNTSASGASAKNAGSYTNTVTTGVEQNYNVTTANGSLNIAKADLAVTGNSSSVTYNGGTQSVAGFTVSGLKGADTVVDLVNVSASGASAKNAGSYANTVSTGTEQNYNIVSTANGTLDIAKADLVATGNSSSVTYNGGTQSVSGFTVSGLKGADTVADLVNVSSSGASAKNAGSYTNTMSSGMEQNYNVSTVNGSLDIAKADLVVTGNSSSVTYNGGTQSVAGFAVSGLKGADTVADLVNVSASGASGKNAGAYTNTMSSGVEQNYNVTTIDGTLDIAKASLTATGNSSSVTYNGGTQSVSGFTVSGLKGADTIADLVNTSASGASAKNAGSYTNTVTTGTEQNYTVSTLNGSLDIAKADLVATGNSSSVTYNGSTQSVSGFTVSGLKGTDTVSDLVNVSASGASAKDAGAYSNTMSSGIEQNYTVSTVNGSLNIAKADALAIGNSSSVTYNGGTQSVSGFTVLGLQGTDTAADLTNVSASGASATNAGSYTNTVTTGLDKNYNVYALDGSLDIAKAALTATGNSSSVTYNGGTQSVAGFTVSGLKGVDTVAYLVNTSASGASGKNAGSYTNTVSTGVEQNYTVSTVNGSLDIAKADLVATGNSSSVTYNGGTQSVSGFTVSGLKGADTVSDLVNVSASGASAKNAGSYTNAVSTGLEQNYNVTSIDGTLAIAKADVVATANSSTVTYNGETQSVAGFTVSGLKGTDTIADLVNTSASSASAKNAGSYTNTMTTGVEQNYNITTTDGSLNIAKADVVATANSSSVVYNGGTQSVAGFTVSGLKGADTVADLVNVSASGASAKNVGSYTNTMSSGVEQNYNITTVDGSLNITKATLVVTGNSSETTYNGGTQSVSGFTVSGLKGADTVSDLVNVSASGASAKNAGTYANTISSDAQQNYIVETNAGTLVIKKANLLATGNSSSVDYNGLTHTVSGFTVSGLQGADTVADLQTVVSEPASGKEAGVYVNKISSGIEQNYIVSTENGQLTIRAVDIIQVNPAVKAADPAKQIQSRVTLVSGLEKMTLANTTEQNVCSATSIDNCVCETKAGAIEICYPSELNKEAR